MQTNSHTLIHSHRLTLVGNNYHSIKPSSFDLAIGQVGLIRQIRSNEEGFRLC